MTLKMKNINNTTIHDEELKDVVGGKDSRDVADLLLLNVGSSAHHTDHPTIAKRSLGFLRELYGVIYGWIHG